MNLSRLLPENQKTRKLILIITVVAVALFGFGFFFVTYFASLPSAGDDVSAAKPKTVTEETIKKLEKDVADIQGELNNSFYDALVRYSWTRDTTAPGNSNPFLK